MLYPKETSKVKQRFGLYKCHCGKEFKANTYNFARGYILGCGCLKVNNRIKKEKPTTSKQEGKNKTHGLSNTRIYRTWSDIKNRCFNSNIKPFKNYGARGITVCNEWKNDFMAFYNWAISNGYKEHLTIDRINNDGNYEPSNCRWATMKEQSLNRRNTRR